MMKPADLIELQIALEYARQTVAAWAHEVIRSGRTAFYSYKVENQPSRALARSLGTEWYADVVGYA